ncbi:hypothetical protein [Stackebrandtia soli]|uniref:hypothetical protein n=1 Tax=Stackebrandtia soli TaxID=1892856 RepID=UPI0039EC6C58
MTETMRTVLPTLPDDLRPAARLLWERSRVITNDVTETLLLSYKILREIKGSPGQLESGADAFGRRVGDHLAAARSDIDDAYPILAEGWRGGGAEAFMDYVPRLSRAIESAQDSALHTVEAIAAFQASLSALWAKVIERTQQTGGEVITVIAEAGDYPLAAVAPVIEIVERFSQFVEQLAESLMQLTSDTHAAGDRLRSATLESLSPNGSGPRLPEPGENAVAPSGWTPAHTAVELDTAAMARMTSALDDAGEHWDKAAEHSADIAREQLTPEAFGLAGTHFWDDLHGVLDRDRELYGAADNQVSGLAKTLRRIGAEYAEADDAAATELRRGLEDT